MLTKIVARRIQPYVDGDKEGFRKEIHKEADRLAKTPFGVPLMHIIAYVPSHAQSFCDKMMLSLPSTSIMHAVVHHAILACGRKYTAAVIVKDRQCHACMLVELSHSIAYGN